MILISQSRGLYVRGARVWQDHFVLDKTIHWTSAIWACLLLLLGAEPSLKHTSSLKLKFNFDTTTIIFWFSDKGKPTFRSLELELSTVVFAT